MIEVSPGPSAPCASVSVPGSKYEANRFLVAAALTAGTTHITGAPEGDDVRAAVVALNALGVRVRKTGTAIEVQGLPRHPLPSVSAAPKTVPVGESGTLLRFLTAVAATVPGPVSIDGNGRIRKRPIAGLVKALKALGVEAK